MIPLQFFRPRLAFRSPLVRSLGLLRKHLLVPPFRHPSTARQTGSRSGSPQRNDSTSCLMLPQLVQTAGKSHKLLLCEMTSRFMDKDRASTGPRDPTKDVKSQRRTFFPHDLAFERRCATCCINTHTHAHIHTDCQPCGHDQSVERGPQTILIARVGKAGC